MPRTRKVMDAAAELSGIDRVIHEPARLAIVSVLRAFETADFIFLLKELIEDYLILMTHKIILTLA